MHLTRVLFFLPSLYPELSSLFLRSPMEEPNWNDLPPELLVKIAERVGAGSEVMKTISSVWKTACEAAACHVSIRGSSLPLNLASRFHSLASLDLQQCTEVSPESLRSLHGLRQLTSLKINLFHLTDALTGPLLELPLASIELAQKPDSYDFTYASLEGPAGLTSVGLDLAYRFDEWDEEGRLIELPPQALAALKSMPFSSLEFNVDRNGDGMRSGEDCGNQGFRDVFVEMPLRKLDLGCEFSGYRRLRRFLLTQPLLDTLNLGCFCTGLESMFAIRGLPITSLDLGDCGEFFKQSYFEILRSLPLKHLGLGIHSNFLKEEMMSFVQGLPSLSSLDLGCVHGFTNDNLAALKGMQLTSLQTQYGYCGSYNKFSDAGLTALLGMPLQVLVLSGVGFTDAGLVFLRDMPLTSLSLASSLISDAGLKVVRKFSLTSLGLDNTNITDAGLEFLCGMPLQTLKLRKTKVTDRGLGFLEGLPLQLLDLGKTEITWVGLKIVEVMQKLESLQLDGCEKLDLKEVAGVWVPRRCRGCGWCRRKSIFG